MPIPPSLLESASIRSDSSPEQCFSDGQKTRAIRYADRMCAVCFTGVQIVPVAAAAVRAWWVKRSTPNPELLDGVGAAFFDRAELLNGVGPELFDSDEPKQSEQRTQTDDPPHRIERELAPVGGGKRDMLYP